MSHSNQPSEHQEQVAVCHYLEANKIPFFAIPNGGVRDPITARRLKESGVKRGVPDLCILLPSITLMLEMKTRTGGKISTEQKEWGEFFSSRPGFVFVVANGAMEAINAIQAQRPNSVRNGSNQTLPKPAIDTKI